MLSTRSDSSFLEDGMIGTSGALHDVRNQMRRVAPTDATVLITGESGTGKELVARGIHQYSRRSTRPFVRFNCASIPPALMISELFGHEKGSFTGADQRRIGRFELASAGTIFLDEIGDIPPETQIALLRVLQEREIERIGGSRPIPVDVRVIAATNRNLLSAVQNGTFRLDLYYRLNVFPLRVPSLQERVADVPLLIEHFVRLYSDRLRKPTPQVSGETMRLFQTCTWPGNIRELQNIIERAVILSDGAQLQIDPRWLHASPNLGRDHGVSSFAEILSHHERELIKMALDRCGGRVAGPEGAASKLGIPRSTLESKIKTLGIQKNRPVHLLTLP